jgi:hypothetical protein
MSAIEMFAASPFSQSNYFKRSAVQEVKQNSTSNVFGIYDSTSSQRFVTVKTNVSISRRGARERDLLACAAARGTVV